MKIRDIFHFFLGCLLFYNISIFAQNEAIYDTNNYNPDVANGNIVIEDTQIASDVKQVVRPTFSHIQVSSQAGVIQLTGSVNSNKEANRLIRLTKSIKGVHDVDTSNLTIK